MTPVGIHGSIRAPIRGETLRDISVRNFWFQEKGGNRHIPFLPIANFTREMSYATVSYMKKIFNWAHRGASGHAPENTLRAFQKAIEMGADGIECDLRESRDGELVVFHDPALKRLAGRRERVNALSLSELKQLDIGSWFSSAFSEERIVTLAEVIEAVPAPLLLNLEIKAASPEKVAEMIQKKKVSDRVIVSSFDHTLLGKLRSLDPVLPLAVLIDREPWAKAFRRAQRLGAVSLNLPSKRIVPEVVAQAHQKGLSVHLYTVNDPDQMAFFIEMGVDGLFTNYPDRLSNLMRNPVTSS